MRCLVTGGLGFIGSHLVERLRELGHYVWVLDDGSNVAVELTRLDTGLTFPRLDVTRADNYSYDWVFHLAAVARTVWAIQDPLRCFYVNAVGSHALLESIRRTNPTARLVLASSNIVYGSPNPYKASKIAMEELMHAYNSLYGLNCIALRYSNVYGPWMRWDDPICLAAMRRSAVERGYIELTGDGSQSRDFTHVSDIVEGTIAAAQSDWKGVLDLTSEDHRTMYGMAYFFGVPVRNVADRPGDTKHIHQNGAMARIRLNWGAKVRVREGIKDVLAEKRPEVAA